MPTRPEFNCPITQDIMANPVTTPCRHTFESTAIGDWIDLGHTCPLCRAPISRAELSPNTELRAQIAREHGPVTETSHPMPASTVAATPLLFGIPAAQHTNFRTTAPRPAPTAAPPRVPAAAAITSPGLVITPELLAAREWHRQARYELQHDQRGTFAALRASNQRAQADGTFDRMRQEMAEDRDGAFAALRAPHQRAQADGTFDRMRQEMTEDRDGTFARLREELRFMRS